MHCVLLVHTAPGWLDEVDRLYGRLDPTGASLLPAYFVKTTFVKMGGRLLALWSGAELLAVGLLFPRALDAGRPVYTLRLHQLGPLPPDDELAAAVEREIAPGRVVLYRPEDARSFGPSSRLTDDFDLGLPSREELAAVRGLYSRIWGVPAEEGYPDDLYSAEFAPGTALVARRDGEVAGFLLGFRRFGLPALEELGLPLQLTLAIESQVMGVKPEQRRFGLAATLKREQARQSLAGGIDLIHWTADPLQYPNAVLNFGRLRAVAGEFTPAYYPFQNALNRVSASRLGITWLPRSARGRQGMAGGESGERSLSRYQGCVILNDGPVTLAAADGAHFLAIEIPGDWTAMQRDEPELATLWRASTDELFELYLGYAHGSYVVVDAAAEGPRRYLVLQRYSEELLAL
jgi:predicted GNAT superfamily acetyltransferase